MINWNKMVKKSKKKILRDTYDLHMKDIRRYSKIAVKQIKDYLIIYFI